MRRKGIGLAAMAALLLVCSSLPAASVDGLIEKLPEDTVAIAVVRIHELQSSPVYRDFEEKFAFGHGLGLDEFIGMTGVDPEHHIESFVIGVRARDAKRKRRAVGLVRGSFDPERIRAALDEAGKERSAGPGGKTFYSVHEPSDGVLTIVDPSLLVFGERSSVAALLEEDGGASRLSADSGLLQAFEAAGTDGQVWGSVSLDDMLPLDGVNNRELTPPLAAVRAMRWASFEIDFGEQLSLRLEGVAESVEEAELIEQAILGMLALAQLSAKEYPDRLALIQAVVVERDGDLITVELTLPMG